MPNATTYHIVGDVHGNFSQLAELLRKLGYAQPNAVTDPYLWRPPDGCMLVSVGDLVDRGPDSLACMRTIQRMVGAGYARWVLGNHEWRFRHLLRYELGLEPEPGPLPRGRLMSYVQILGLTQREKQELLDFIDSTPIFLELAGGRLVVSHALWNSRCPRLKGDQLVQACAFGRADWTDPATDALELAYEPPSGRPMVVLPEQVRLPARAQWTRHWKGPAEVVWGHQIVLPGHVVRIGRTINVESGCFQGFALSAYIWPDDAVVQVAGARPWKNRVKEYDTANAVAFPHSVDAVAAVVRRNGLACEDDYLAWLDLELEARGAPPPFAELVDSHRRIYRRTRSHGTSS